MQKKLVIRPVKPGEPRLTNEEAVAFLRMIASYKNEDSNTLPKRYEDDPTNDEESDS